jgi:hypothetical protein
LRGRGYFEGENIGYFLGLISVYVIVITLNRG